MTGEPPEKLEVTRGKAVVLGDGHVSDQTCDHIRIPGNSASPPREGQTTSKPQKGALGEGRIAEAATPDASSHTVLVQQG